MTFGTWCATVSGYLQRKFLHTRSRIPVVAVALGIVLAGEHLSKHELIGGAIVLTVAHYHTLRAQFRAKQPFEVEENTNTTPGFNNLERCHA